MGGSVLSVKALSAAILVLHVKTDSETLTPYRQTNGVKKWVIPAFPLGPGTR